MSISSNFENLFRELQFLINDYYNVIMSELVEPVEKIERQVEGKYKYLADFARNQFSPNLRKHYNDSFSKRSNSQDRASPHLNSNDRRSPFRNSPPQRRPYQHYSPSCSTFNPRREITQEEFSPYDERIEKEDDRLNKELLEENTLLKTQLLQSEKTIDALKLELSKRDTDILKVKEASQADLRYFEKIVAEMTNEIQIVLTKNKILENQLIVVKSRLQEEMRRHEEQLKYEEERRLMEEFRRREDYRRPLEEAKRDENRQRRNTPQPVSKRSVGKLMSRPAPNHHNETMKASKIKIEEDSQSVSQSNFETNKPVDAKLSNAQAEKENRNGESLISSIRSMQLKISGEQSASLKDLWKWLKGLGQTHSSLKRWKGKATEASSYYPSDKLRDLIREACGYIQ